jgi:3-deoxy-7-phosphoheptulonate synthase
MQQTQDLRVIGTKRLQAPRAIKTALPTTGRTNRTVVESRAAVQNILAQRDPRLLVVVGPCSIHDTNGAMEYAHKLAGLSREIADQMFIVMRVYFEKPRTTIGWKGLINDPHMNNSCDIEEGVRIARKLLLDINELGLPAATEFLDPIVPQYLDDLSRGRRSARAPPKARRIAKWRAGFRCPSVSRTPRTARFKSRLMR